jgi:hypothetical protein
VTVHHPPLNFFFYRLAFSVVIKPAASPLTLITNNLLFMWQKIIWSLWNWWGWRSKWGDCSRIEASRSWRAAACSISSCWDVCTGEDQRGVKGGLHGI